MRYIFFTLGLINWLIFAYDIENDRDFMTWMWLFVSLFFFVNSYIRYKHDMKPKNKNGLPELCSSCFRRNIHNKDFCKCGKQFTSNNKV